MRPLRPLPVRTPPRFFGRWVVRAAFVMAMFGWGVGFYGPSIFLHAVVQRTGWSLTLVSTAVTLHYLFGALVITRMPWLHRRFGVGPTAVAGATCAAVGVVCWSIAGQPWQLLLSALLSGGGWVTMGAVAVNAAIAPWYVRGRPMALAKAYNGASLGGVLFSPLWVMLIGRWGFSAGACLVGLVMVAVMTGLSVAVFGKTPEQLGQRPDGEAIAVAASGANSPTRPRLSGHRLWRDPRFVTLALGMAAGLFAQIGLLAHLFSLLVPVLGAQRAGLAMGFATACAIGGRMVVARLLPAGADRRVVAATGHGVQLAGSMVLLAAGDSQTAWILLGVALFGSGIGNATSLPPLIAQAEFAPQDVPQVVASIVATAQASYAFAPAALGLLLGASSAVAPHQGIGPPAFLLAVAAIQSVAVLSLLSGRRAARDPVGRPSQPGA